MHDGRVAEPTSLAARCPVLDILQTELVDNDVHQIQHSHKLVVAKVENVFALFGMLHAIKNALTPSITSRYDLRCFPSPRISSRWGLALNFFRKSNMTPCVYRSPIHDTKRKM